MLTFTVPLYSPDTLKDNPVSFLEGIEFPLKSLLCSVLAVNSGSPAALEKE